ncbi:unnamed protein product, partial [Meganyctiphanes norvegica]
MTHKELRPIALLEILAKIYETIIYRRLKWHLEDGGLLDESQFGFRARRSTHHSVNILLNYLQTNRRRRRDVLLVCKDVEKAFDTVWKEGLIFKLFRSQTLNLPPLLCKILASYLTDRSIKIKYGNKIAQPFTPKAGVPQGSVLAPLLYIIYLNDRPHPTRDHTDPSTETLNIFYADDNNLAISGGLKNIIADAKVEIQTMTDWELKWRIRINPQKSKILLFGPNRKTIKKRLQFHPITTNPLYPERGGATIPVTASHDILGIHIDTNLSFVAHIKRLRQSVNRARKSFLRFICLSNKIREFLYKVYILPKIQYAYPIYPFLSHTQILAIQAIQNNCIYHFIYTYKEAGHTRADSLHITTNLEAINNQFHKKAKKFYKHLEEIHPLWHNTLNQWHSTAIRENKKHIITVTPKEWASQPLTRPIYSKKH